jgi:hypothetical protein
MVMPTAEEAVVSLSYRSAILSRDYFGHEDHTADIPAWSVASGVWRMPA